MRRSRMLESDREDLIARCRRLSPEARLTAFFRHSQLMHEMYRAGASYRAGALASPKKRRGQRR